MLYTTKHMYKHALLQFPTHHDGISITCLDSSLVLLPTMLPIRWIWLCHFATLLLPTLVTNSVANLDTFLLPIWLHCCFQRLSPIVLPIWIHVCCQFGYTIVAIVACGRYGEILTLVVATFSHRLITFCDPILYIGRGLGNNVAKPPWLAPEMLAITY